MKRIGVIGCGFVGTAVAQGMEHAFTVFGYDLKWRNLKRWGKPDGEASKLVLQDHAYSFNGLLEIVDGPIFVCVPTPMRPNGECDTSIVEKVVCDIDHYVMKNPGLSNTVVIKSTVPPGTTHRLNESCAWINVCFNPEFLREVTAIDDFKNQDRIILGGPHAGTRVLKQVYQQSYPDVPTTKTHSTIAEMVKYVTNCFLATKVAFANEVYQICEALPDEVDYDKVIEYATKDKRLGMSHWAVPGFDGKYGFGGTCFPKDLNGLMATAERLGVRPQVMEGVWKKNLEVRPEKDWEDMKGRAVTD